MDTQKIFTRCCISGGGPAGMILGLLLARAGIETIVLEKWPDFFRDFRGDTIHPATFEILYELGLLEDFLKLPINKTYQLAAEIGDEKIVLADFSHLKLHCPFIGFIPQWEFLNFIREQAKRYSTFHLMMETECQDLLYDENKIIGVIANNQNTSLEIHADIVIGADGRHSTIREKSGLIVEHLGAPMDVLWFHLSRKITDSQQTLGKIDRGRILIMIERGDYWQCGFVIPKGGFNEVQKKGLDIFRQRLIELVPHFKERIGEIHSWEQIKLLTVAVDRLQQWYRPGLLCIGDAAHAMSPIGGVGINLAIQDAVAAANRLIPALQTNTLTEKTLRAIQKRRMLPTRLIQKIQVLVQNRIIQRVISHTAHPKVPWGFKLLNWFPALRRIPAYLIGVGFRPEHITPPCNDLV